MIIQKGSTSNNGNGNNNNNNSNSNILRSGTMINLEVTKYLDHKGARELVAQFKAYVDGLVGGNS